MAFTSGQLAEHTLLNILDITQLLRLLLDYYVILTLFIRDLAFILFD